MNEYIEKIIKDHEQHILLYEREISDAEEGIAYNKEKIEEFKKIPDDIKFYEMPNITYSFFCYMIPHYIEDTIILFLEDLKEYIKFEKYKKEHPSRLKPEIHNFDYYDNIIKHLEDNNFYGIIHFVKKS